MNDETILTATDAVRTFAVRSGNFGPKQQLTAVDRASVGLRANETVALVGESGSGKSTLGRMLLGLLEPSDGEIAYRGSNITELGRGDWATFRRRVQVVFQDTGSTLNPRKRIATSLAVPLRHHLGLGASAAREKADELLALVGLEPAIFADRYPHQLSGGQRQRVGIARALAPEPEIVIADEPVSALDVSVRADVLKTMVELQRRTGVGYLLISHDLGVVRSVADRVLVMYLGQIVEEGPTEQIFTRPGHPYTQALLAATPDVDLAKRDRQRVLPVGEIPSPTNPPPGCRFHPRCPHVESLCREGEVPSLAVGDGHRARCHFAEQVQHAGH